MPCGAIISNYAMQGQTPCQPYAPRGASFSCIARGGICPHGQSGWHGAFPYFSVSSFFFCLKMLKCSLGFTFTFVPKVVLV